jgi:hypothetical protein
MPLIDGGMGLGGELSPNKCEGVATLSPALWLSADAQPQTPSPRPDGNKVPTGAPVLSWLPVSVVMLVLGAIRRLCWARQSGGHGGFRGRRGVSSPCFSRTESRQLALFARTCCRPVVADAHTTGAATKQLPRRELWRAPSKPRQPAANQRQQLQHSIGAAAAKLKPSFVNLTMSDDDPSRPIKDITASPQHGEHCLILGRGPFIRILRRIR